MNVKDDIKKQAAKSNGWKWGIVVVLILGFVGFIAIGKKDEAFKLVEIAGEVIAINTDGEVVGSSVPVSITTVDDGEIVSTTTVSSTDINTFISNTAK